MAKTRKPTEKEQIVNSALKKLRRGQIHATPHTIESGLVQAQAMGTKEFLKLAQSLFYEYQRTLRQIEQLIEKEKMDSLDLEVNIAVRIQKDKKDELERKGKFIEDADARGSEINPIGKSIVMELPWRLPELTEKLRNIAGLLIHYGLDVGGKYCERCLEPRPKGSPDNERWCKKCKATVRQERRRTKN
ncbi:hypothetical protein ACFL2P_01365 [Candidatus Moduliflexota bacterium]